MKRIQAVIVALVIIAAGCSEDYGKEPGTASDIATNLVTWEDGFQAHCASMAMSQGGVAIWCEPVKGQG